MSKHPMQLVEEKRNRLVDDMVQLENIGGKPSKDTQELLAHLTRQLGEYRCGRDPAPKSIAWRILL